MTKSNLSLYNLFIALSISVGIFTATTELKSSSSVDTWGLLFTIISAVILSLNVYLNSKKTSFFYPLFAEKLSMQSGKLKLLRVYQHLIKPLLVFILTVFLLLTSESPLIIAILFVLSILYYYLFETVKVHDFEAHPETTIIYDAHTFFIHFLSASIIANLSVSGIISPIIALILYTILSFFILTQITHLRYSRIKSFLREKRKVAIIFCIAVFYVLNFGGFILLQDPNIIFVGLNSLVQLILGILICLEIQKSKLTGSKLINYGIVYCSFLLLVLVL